MSIQVNSRAVAPPQTAAPPAAAHSAVAQASGDAPSAPKLERVHLPETKRVDLGFRAEEMRKNLHEAVARLNEQMQSKGRDLSFSLDERIDRTIITVKNLQTGEVVRQIPTEEVVRMAHSIEDMKGVLFNKVL
jgi:flagellar protein FlaG